VDGTKSFSAASVCNNFPPAGTVTVFSPLIVILTSPEETSLLLANTMIETKVKTIIVNRVIPRTKVSI
jgi:hypothetical protein